MSGIDPSYVMKLYITFLDSILYEEFQNDIVDDVKRKANEQNIKFCSSSIDSGF